MNDERRKKAYADAALDSACAAIRMSQNGQQEETLHREIWGIGNLVGAGVLEERQAFAELFDAARAMPSYRDRWRETELRQKISASLRRGMQSPRNIPHAATAAATTTATAGVTTTAQALALWERSQDPCGTLAEAYLRSRSLTLAGETGALGFVPSAALPRSPEGTAGALLCLLRNIRTDAPQAVSRIFLDKDARKLDRRFLGPSGDAACKLDPDAAVTNGLFVGEGVESCMAARQAFGLRPAWALMSAGGIVSFPVLDGIESLTLFIENGCPENARAVEACAERWFMAGREVLIDEPIGGKDHNDVLMLRRTPPP